MSNRSMSRPLALALAAAVAALGLASCGGTESTAETKPAGAAGTFPVTVEHKYGKTEVKKAPTRVVTLGYSDHEAVLALGVKPVGVVDWFGEKPFGDFPWQKELWGGAKPEIVGERDEYNVEKIAAVKPDLILAQYSGLKKEQYETLSKLAPVVAQSTKYENFGAPWQEQTRRIGLALGKEKRAEELIDAIADKFAKVRKEHPEFAGKTVAVADNYEPGKYAAFSPTDPKTVFMAELGFKPSPKIADAAGKRFAAEFGSERLDLLDVDTLIWLNWDTAAEPRIKADAVYQKLKVVQDKRDVFLPYNTPPLGASMSFNSVLSIPYGIDQVVPRLAAAAK